MSKEDKPLKKYRSHAERIAMYQRYAQIVLTATTVVISLITLLRVFGVI